MQFLGIEHRDDSVSMEDCGRVSVCDPWGVPILYDTAIKEMQSLSNQLILIGSHYILQERKRRESDYSRLHLSANLAEQGQLVLENVDREQLISDLFECELNYQYAKKALMDVYTQAYEHCTSRGMILLIFVLFFVKSN
jgi:hypothetical protein